MARIDPFDQLSAVYALSLNTSIRVTWEQLINETYARLFNKPLVRINDKLLLETECEVLRNGRGPASGIQLRVYGMVSAKEKRMLREQCVPPSTGDKEQRRLLEAMCNIVAVQESCDYKLRAPIRVHVLPKQHNRPFKGKYQG